MADETIYTAAWDYALTSDSGFVRCDGAIPSDETKALLRLVLRYRDELADVRRAYDAACAYIGVSVCDNDTTAEMWQAWQVFDDARKALEARPC